MCARKQRQGEHDTVLPPKHCYGICGTHILQETTGEEEFTGEDETTGGEETTGEEFK